jgi:tRNA threonylcarbamoyladenosine biosynthesis protein TsaE
MEKKFLSKSASETREIGKSFAEKLVKEKGLKEALVLALEGELGGGKTTFVQGLAKGLGIREKILSPTFVLMRSFRVRNDSFKKLFHVDCYRIKNPEDMVRLGFDKIVSNRENFVVVEWAKRIKSILPKSKIKINFKFIDENKREIKIKWKQKN